MFGVPQALIFKVEVRALVAGANKGGHSLIDKLGHIVGFSERQMVAQDALPWKVAVGDLNSDLHRNRRGQLQDLSRRNLNH
jgi:hypothetical protein